MTKNVFDQFDEAPSAGGNVFDQFDTTPAAPTPIAAEIRAKRKRNAFGAELPEQADLQASEPDAPPAERGYGEAAGDMGTSFAERSGGAVKELGNFIKAPVAATKQAATGFYSLLANLRAKHSIAGDKGDAAARQAVADTWNQELIGATEALIEARAESKGTVRGAVGDTMAEAGKDAEKYWQEKLTPKGRALKEGFGKAKGVDSISFLYDNPEYLPQFLAGVAPDTIIGLGATKAATLPGKVVGLSDKAMLPLATTAAIGTEAGQSAIGAQTQIAERIAQMPDEDFDRNADFQQLMARYNGDRQKAKEVLALAIAGRYSGVTGAATAFGSIVTGGGRATAEALQSAATTAGSAARNVGKDTGEEVVQGLGEDYAQYSAEGEVDPNAEFDPIKSAVTNAVGGFGMSAPTQAAGYAGAKLAERKDSQGTPPAQAVPAEQETTAADLAGQQAVQAAPVAPPPTVDQSPDLQMQNRDRGTTASVVQMQSISNAPDFDRLNASPIADVGAPLVSVKDNAIESLPQEDAGTGGEITLPDGAKVQFRYAVVDAGQILASHDASGRANPDYGNPQPGQIVALTNGRVAGLQEAYARGTASQPGGYMDRLLEDGAKFGISPESITNKEAPVLVRVYDDSVNARPDIGRMSNSGGSARMSASEVARNDARILPDVSNLVVSETGDIDTPANLPFVRGFVQALPENERAEVLDRDGRLSQVGMRRIRNAIIHRAYGESSVFGRLVESMDSGMANLSKALVRAAPKVAKVKELMAAGAVRDMDITGTLVRAVAELERMRTDGISLAQFLAQARLLDQLPSGLVEVLAYLDANIRAPNRIAAFIEAYYHNLENLGDPRTADMFGAPEVGADQMLNAAAQVANQETADGLDAIRSDAGSGEAAGQGNVADAGGSSGGQAAAPVPGNDGAGAGAGAGQQEPAGLGGGAASVNGTNGQAASGLAEASSEEGRADAAGGVADRRLLDGGEPDASGREAAAGSPAPSSGASEPARDGGRVAEAVAPVSKEIKVARKKREAKKAEPTPADESQPKEQSRGQEQKAPETAEVLKPDAGAEPAKVGASISEEIRAKRERLVDKVDAAAHEAATSPKNDLPEPTPAMKEAGNYTKGHLTLHGMDISIENPAGSERVAKDESWRVTMPVHYGYFKGTEGADGDHVDVFIGPNPELTQAWIINQRQPLDAEPNSSDATFDEHKVLIGFKTADEAISGYLKSFEGDFGRKVFQSISPSMGIDELKDKLPSLKKALPVRVDKDATAAAERAYSKAQADTYAKRMTAQGFPSEVVPHPAQAGKFAIRAAADKMEPVSQKPEESDRPGERVAASNAAEGKDTAATLPSEEPKERDSFTLKRLVGDKLEPVTFERGEYVRYTLSGKDHFGDIDGISHARREFSVDGLWYPFGFAYKAERPAEAVQQTVPMSEVIDDMNSKNGEGLGDADRIHTVSFHNALFDRVRAGNVTVEQFKAAFESAVKSKDMIVAELAAMTKAKIIEQFPDISYRYKNETKDRVVDAAYSDMLTDFTLGQGFTYTMGRGSYIDGIRAKVEQVTDESLAKYAQQYKDALAEREQRQQEAESGMENPETLDDFKRLINAKAREIGDGATFRQAFMAMQSEHRARFDELTAERSRGERMARADQQKTEVRVAATTTEGQIVETKHTKTGEPLFVVKSAERVERDVYNHWNATAKRMGGWYSSYRGGGAVPGFQFKTRENADAFLEFIGGNAEKAKEVVQERRDVFSDDRSQTAVERLTEMAGRLDERADESLGQERKANTARRARFAASAEASANDDKAMAQTMRNLASAIESGKAKFLDRVRQKVQIGMLNSLVHSAQWEYWRAKYPTWAEQEKHKGERPVAEVADYAEFPQYTAFRSDLARLGRQLLEIDGAKKIGQRLLKVADDVTDAYLKFAKENLHKVSTFKRSDGSMAAFKSKDDAEAAIARSGYKGKAIVLPVKRGENVIVQSPSFARENGIWQGDDDRRITLDRDFGAEIVAKNKEMSQDKLDMPYTFNYVSEKQARLKALGIETPAEFRAALREFIGLKQAPKAPDRVKELERAMAGKRNTDGLDFFPTPSSTVEAMLDAAEIQEGMSVLEPSAGMGHIADMIRESGVEPDVVELSGERRELLEAKGYSVVGSDFLDLTGRESFTFGDVFKAPDGKTGIMSGSGGMGSNRVTLRDADNKTIGYYDRSELEGIEKRKDGYDRILMNPPFGDRRDAEHVRHAFDLLKSGGRLVAIMGEGVFYGQDKKAQAFRAWLESVGGTSEKLEEGTFLDPSLPVNTGVNARMVVVDKPASEVGSGAVLSRSHGGGIHGDDLRAVIQKARMAFPGLPIRDLENERQAPKALRDEIAAANANGEVAGALHAGEVYMFKSGLRDIAHAEAVLVHEATHAGLRRMFGKALDPVMLDIHKSNIKVQLRSAKIRKQFGYSTVRSVDEVLADMGPDAKSLNGWQQLVAWVRGRLRAAGLVKDWTDSDIEALVLKALAAAKNPNNSHITPTTALSAGLSREGFAHVFLQELAVEDAMFRYPTSQRKDLPGVFDEVFPGVLYYGEHTQVDEKSETEADHRFVFQTPRQKLEDGTTRPGQRFWVFTTDDKRAWVNVLNLQPGEQGGRIYAAVANWAHNAGYVFVGDPLGVSPAAIIARTKMMLSSALRHGTTKHLDASREQERGLEDEGIAPLDWRGSDVEKTRALIHSYIKTVHNLAPGIKGFRYDFAKRRFIGPDGAEFHPTSSGFDAALGEGERRAARIGKDSGRAAILIQSLVSGEGGQAGDGGILQAVLDDPNSLIDGGLRGVFSRSDVGDITQTPAFKKWFGDSKVVDADGDPIRVYHGTAFDFTAFDPLSLGNNTKAKSARQGFFFAASQKVASGYGMLSGALTGGEWIREAGGGVSGANVLPVFLSIKNPMVVDYGGTDFREAGFSSVIQEAKSAGHDGVVFKNAEDSMHQEYSEPTDIYVAFDPAQIKSAIGNRGTFDPGNPDIRFSRAGQAATPKEQALQRVEEILRRRASGETITDKLIRVPTQMVGAEKAIRALGRLVRSVADNTPETIKAGVVSDYAIPEAVIDRRDAMFGHQRKQLRGLGETLEQLEGLTFDQRRVAYEWLNNRNADHLLDGLSAEQRAVMDGIKQQIDEFGREAVDLGLLSADAYETHKGAYVHRSYRKWDIEQDKGERTARARSKVILGEQFKGRGLTELAPMQRVQNTNPGFWKRKTKTGKADQDLRGEEFIRFERWSKGVGSGNLFDAGADRGKMLEVQYWPKAEPVPARYGAWHEAGTFTVRGTKGDKLVMHRDWTKPERERMGEIEDANYAIAKTFHQMIHDIEVAKYLRWVGSQYGQVEAPRGVVPIEAKEALSATFGKDDWVQVPESKVSGTDIKKYSGLAGLYIPGPIWNDIRQVVNTRYQPFGRYYANILKAWKISKTSLSPAVHMNNVMANMVMADWHDVRAIDVAEALKIVLLQNKRPEYKELLGRFEDAGGTQGMYILSEIQREQLEPIIEKLRAEVEQAGEMQGMVGASAALQALLNRRITEAYEAARGSKGGKVSAAAVRKIMDIYQGEDTVFRLAAFLKAKRNGESDQAAGKAARRSFLDYQINAPWINVMRQTAFPFISFTYRAVPMLLKTIETRPWKIMKLGLFAGLINAIGYGMSGGDEDKERKLLAKEKAGRIWGVVPKLVRMPWNDEHGSPVFLDIRRWVPVGDVLDTGQTHAAVPWLPFAVPGGPLAITAELLANKSQFTGKELVKETDSAGEAAAAVYDHLYKAFAPNIMVLPGTYAFNGMWDAGTGKTDSFGREKDMTMAGLSSVGVKIAAYPQDAAAQNKQFEFQRDKSEIERNMKRSAREFARKGMSQEEFQEALKRDLEKLQKRAKEYQETLQ